MKDPYYCPFCHRNFDLYFSAKCPWCGYEPAQAAPQPPPHPTAPEKRGWGGQRQGAGAPTGNLNRLVAGGSSKLLRKGIEKLAADPEMRAVLLIITRLATENMVPPATKKLILKITQPKRRTRKQVKEVLNAKTLGD